MVLWDVAWTRSKTENFSLFVAVAVLDLHEADIVNTARRPDEMLEFFAQLVTRTSCEQAIQRARMVSQEAGARAEFEDKGRVRRRGRLVVTSSSLIETIAYVSSSP